MKNKAKAIAVSGMVIAIYVVIMYFTQSFAFGVYQIRIATSLYSLSYFFPFLIVPLGFANFLSNFLGNLGVWDILGGTVVGIITSGGVYLVRRLRLPKLTVIPVIILGPGLLVPVWLSIIYGIPYPVLVVNLCIGQALPAVLGCIIIKILSEIRIDKIWNQNGL